MIRPITAFLQNGFTRAWSRACLSAFMFVALMIGQALQGAPASASAPARPSASADAGSFHPLFSADGRRLVFVSHANNLVTNDGVNSCLDVFVRDLAGNDIVLVSMSASGMGGANADANFPCISSNGQFIAFASRASNLVAGDTNDAVDVFVRDTVGGTTRLVSVDIHGNSPVDPLPSLNSPLSSYPLISADGRWVFFESRATNLSAMPVPPNGMNIYARDMWSNVTVLVTVDTNGLPVGGRCELKSVTPNGRFVAFIATNVVLVTNAPNRGSEAYVRDLMESVTIWATRDASALMGTNEYIAETAVFSGGGDYVLCAVLNRFRTARVFRYDLATLETQALPMPTGEALDISDNGRYVLHAAAATYVYDFLEQTNIQVSWKAALGSCNGSAGCGQPIELSYGAQMTPDGRYVVFFLYDGNVSDDLAPHHIYRRDLVTGASNLVLTAMNGLPKDARTGLGRLGFSNDGQKIAVHGTVDDLVNDDANGANDVFLRHVNAATNELISTALFTPDTARPQRLLSLNSISGDGTRVVFTGHDDLTAYRDTNDMADIFLADFETGSTRALSIDTNLYVDGFGYPATNPVPNTNAYIRAIISADGSTVAGLRRRSYVGLPTSDIFVMRASNGVFNTGTHLANRFGQPMYAETLSLSADGQLLAFSTPAADVTDWDGDWNNTGDVFVRSFQRFTNITFYGTNYYFVTTPFLVSRSTNAYYTGSTISTNPVLSSDGLWVAFQTLAADIVASQTPADLAYPPQSSWPYTRKQLVVGDLTANRYNTNYLERITNRLCSYTIWTNGDATGGPDAGFPNTVLRPLTNEVLSAFWSANSRYIFFGVTNPTAFYRHDILGVRTNWYMRSFESNGAPAQELTNAIVPGAPNLFVCNDCRNLSVNAHGTIVAFERMRTGSSVIDVLVKHLDTGEEFLVSAGLNGALGNASSLAPQVSADGRYVVFQSKASNLVSIDNNRAADIFVRDMLLGVTMLLSANGAGLPANGPSSRPVMAADGRSVAFQSFANDLVARDYNDNRDIFVLKLGGADTDSDGIDDDWEVAYFDDLSRNGQDDFDADGATDAAEFLAGTDPLNDASVLHVLNVSFTGNGARQVIWTGNPTRTYRVEYKTDLNAEPWRIVHGPISWNGFTAFIIDSSAANSPHRYYRAVRLP